MSSEYPHGDLIHFWLFCSLGTGKIHMKCRIVVTSWEEGRYWKQVNGEAFISLVVSLVYLFALELFVCF